MKNKLRFDRRALIRSALDQFEVPLIRYAARIIGQTEAARDVVQEVFLRLWNEDAAAMDGHLAQWLYTVCRNRALDVRRKESRMQQLDGAMISESPTSDTDPARQAERHEGSSDVLAALCGLPESQQEAIRLRFQSGLRYKEIAGVMNVSVSHVGVLIHTGLKKIRNHVGRSEAKQIKG